MHQRLVRRGNGLLHGDHGGPDRDITAAMISGYRIINRSVRFDLSTLSPEDLARYTSYRITANRGALLQAL